MPTTTDMSPAAAGEPASLDLLAHELRTPLAAIVALAEVMRDEHLGPIGNDRYRGYASDIRDSAEHALEVLAAILGPAAGRDESIAADSKPDDIDAALVVEGCVSALTPLAVQRGIAIAAVRPELPARVRVDRRCLRQMLDNLLSNALRFTPPGGTVTVTTDVAGDGTTTITVADSGPGIAALAGSAQPPRMLRPHDGAGFGLPLVHALAAAAGGTVEIDSAPGRGTRIALVFRPMAGTAGYP